MNNNTPPEPPSSSAAERFVVWLMVLFFVGFGWSILLMGGVSISGKKGVSHFTGNASLVMVGISFFVAFVTSFLVIKVMGYGRKGAAALIALILLPPAVFVLRMVLSGQITL